MGGVERDTGTWGRLDEFNVDGSLPIKGMTIEEFPRPYLCYMLIKSSANSDSPDLHVLKFDSVRCSQQMQGSPLT